MKYWKNKRTGVKYHEGSMATKYKSHYFKNKHTGEKYLTGAHSEVSYKKIGFLGRKRQTIAGKYHKGNKYRYNVYDSYKK